MRAFIDHLRQHGTAPHIAGIDGRRTPGRDGRTTRQQSYRTSQHKRKRAEEIFGWLKTIGGPRKSRFIGQARTQMYAHLAGAAYNLPWISRSAMA